MAGSLRKSSVAVASMSTSPCSSTKPCSASGSPARSASARFIVPYFAQRQSRGPTTVPGTPTARWPSVLRPLTTLPSASRYMSAVAASGAFSRKSRKVLRPSASCIVMKPPPPRLPAAGIDDRQRIADGDRGVDGVAAVASARRRRPRVARCWARHDHAVLGRDRRRRGGARPRAPSGDGEQQRQDEGAGAARACGHRSRRSSRA